MSLHPQDLRVVWLVDMKCRVAACDLPTTWIPQLTKRGSRLDLIFLHTPITSGAKKGYGKPTIGGSDDLS